MNPTTQRQFPVEYNRKIRMKTNIIGFRFTTLSIESDLVLYSCVFFVLFSHPM